MVSLAVLGSLLYGTSLAVLSFTKFVLQREFLKGDNKNIALSIGILQTIMASVLMTSITLAFPAIAALRLVYYLGIGLSLLPIAASLAAGGYAQFKKSCGSLDDPFVKYLITNIDLLVNKIPTHISSMLARCHPWFGTVLFIAQIGVFGCMIPLQPIIGFAGLSYFALYYLRGKNKLPAFLAKTLEKFNYWINLFSGIFISNKFLQVAAFCGIAKEFVVNVVTPRLLKKYLGNNSEFLQVADLTVAPKLAPQIPRNITKKNFRFLLCSMPDLSLSQLNSKDISRDRVQNILAELKMTELDLQQEIEQIYTQHTQQDALTRQRRNELANSCNLPDLPEQPKGFFKKIKHYTGYIASYPRHALVVLQRSYSCIKIHVQACTSFLKKVESKEGKGLAVNMSHMADATFCLPAAPQTTLNEFQQLISTKELEQSVNSFKQGCLASAKFQSINLDLQGRLLELKKDNKHPSSEKIDDNNRKIAEINQQLLQAWRDKLALPVNASENDIIIKYITKRLEDVYDKIFTGTDMLWDKTSDSFAVLQQLGFHLIAHCRELLQKRDKGSVIEAHDILGRLAIEAGDFCANGVYDVVKDLFERNVLPKLNVGKENLTAKDELALYLQQQRQDLFDACYNCFTDHPLVKTRYPDIDFQDRHAYSFIMSYFGILNLKASFNAHSDLSTTNNKTDFITQMQYNLYTYCMMRFMMVLESAYSPKAILNSLSQATGGDFNVMKCCSKWAQKFIPELSRDPSITGIHTDAPGYIVELLGAFSSNAAEQKIAEEGRRRLYTLMLYDLGVFKITDPVLAEKIAIVLREPQQDCDINDLEDRAKAFELEDMQAPSQDLSSFAPTVITSFAKFKGKGPSDVVKQVPDNAFTSSIKARLGGG